MLSPKKTKFRKWQTARKHPEKRKSPAGRGITIAFGSVGLKALTPSRVTSNQIEAARRVIVRTAGKGAKMWIRIFPDRPITKKAAEVGMGKGKGDLDHYVADVRPGHVMFEVDGAPINVAKDALRKAGMKLPLKVKVVERE
ncbi:50S ribosomal protein L16 [Candidatus Kaiserbacteria bacterium CG10_big_fil_rev_8_21_14_0_10_43_70]|uniref:Large ribosomal subunit protein uL16 n=1 Tax=Candidatus Kaiserbacteria bacterium CG10_big_fil_rev_8_21_14_0_10_43_70 TaxID=1974605 RepID=A0A2H0UJG6_9BACT|nr:MAG: 50S ribosomal protein L16 [Candidatus Kaiserbacteria bacterium CG10_big_fil_rev_8_21_14_0_10_43_70]